MIYEKIKICDLLDFNFEKMFFFYHNNDNNNLIITTITKVMTALKIQKSSWFDLIF